MAIWVTECTWQFGQINISVAAQVDVQTQYKAVLLAIKTAMLALATNPFTVSRSSNKTSAGASDYWSTVADLTAAAEGNAHSWIVLRNANGSEILINLSTASAVQSAAFSFSPSGGFSLAAGGTNGSTTAAPTATDAVPITVTGTSWINLAAAAVCKVNVVSSTNAYSTRVIVFSAGSLKAFLAYEYATDTVATPTAWTPPIAFMVNGYAAALTWADALGNTSPWHIRYNGANYTCYGTTECTYNGTPVGQIASGVPNDTCAAYGASPYGLGSATVNIRGRQGRIRDMWIGSSAVATGSGYPSTGPSFIQVGQMITPWDGATAIQLT